VDNNYLDLGMSKSGFIHTLPVAGLDNADEIMRNSCWKLLSAS
jgi:hypothetical protein